MRKALGALSYPLVKELFSKSSLTSFKDFHGAVRCEGNPKDRTSRRRLDCGGSEQLRFCRIREVRIVPDGNK